MKDYIFQFIDADEEQMPKLPQGRQAPLGVFGLVSFPLVGMPPTLPAESRSSSS